MVEFPIRAFRLNGIDGFCEIYISEVFGFPEQTDFDGGYGARGYINLKANSYEVLNGGLWLSTGALYRFFKQLKPCYDKISGEASFTTLEHDFELKANFKNNGHVIITGTYEEKPDIGNRLQFEITSDQSQILEVLIDLKKIEGLFGDETGFGAK
jgi:hypothetical protein